MGRAVLIVLLTGIIIFGVVSIQMNRLTSETGKATTKYYRDLYSRNLASSMIDLLRIKLNEDTSFRVNNFQKEDLMQGKVVYKLIDTIINSTRFIKAVVIAEYEDVQKTSEAYFSIQKFESNGVPPFLKYAVVSGGSLQLNGGVKITNAGSGLNANVHVNGDFFMNGNNEIYGFLTYTGSANSNPESFLNRNIRPISNPNNSPVHYQTGEIEIPIIDPDEIRTKATEIYYGNKVFNGNITLGTKENPKIIYVSGDLTLNGNVRGYGIFVSRGRTIINGNVTLISPDPNVGNIGIYSDDELVVNRNVTLNAQVFSNKYVNLNENVKVYGNLVSKESARMNGNVEVYYKPVNESLTKPVWSMASNENVVQVKTIHFYE